MSNVFRIGCLDSITVETVPLPTDHPVSRISDISPVTIDAIIASGWEALDRHSLSFPIRFIHGFTIWNFFVPGDAVQGLPFPSQDDPNRCVAIEALNGALQLCYRRRAAEMRLHVVAIDFFMCAGESGVLYAYVDTNGMLQSPYDPSFFLGDADFSMGGVGATLLRQSNTLLLQASLTAGPSTSNASTPRASPSLPKISKAILGSPATTRDTGLRTCSTSRVRPTPTACSSSAALPQPTKVRACICKPSGGQSRFVVEPRSSSSVITLPDIVSIRFGAKSSPFVPRRVRYGPVAAPVTAATDGAGDVMDMDPPVTSEACLAGDRDDGSFLTDTSSDSDARSSASVLLNSTRNDDIVNRPGPIDAQTLVLLQQHSHDPFFGAVLAQTWRQSVPSSVPFPVFLPRSCSVSTRARRLLLASNILPGWREVTNPLPVQQIRAEAVIPDLKELQTVEQVVLNDCDLLLGFDGDIRTLSAAAVEFWEESCLEPFKSKADVSYVVVLPHDLSESETSLLVEPFFEAVSSMYEASMLGHHTPIKCYGEILALSARFQEAIAFGSKSDRDLISRYHEFVLDAMNTAAMRSKLTSTDISIVVIYIVIDGVLPTDPRTFAAFVNRLRLVLGAPTWNSTSRRKNVVGQIVPLSLIHGLYSSSPIALLRQLVFSVFSRNHFVPAIPVDTGLAPKLNSGLGLTAFEPAYVVHNEYGVPNPSQPTQRSRLAVHVAYVAIQSGEYSEWIVACATDMRGERLHTACVERGSGQPFSAVLTSLWVDCLRPVLDFLHSRTDQGPMTIAVCKFGTLSTDECAMWTMLFANRLGGNWSEFRERDLSGRSSVAVRNSKSSSQVDLHFSVSAAFLISCPSSSNLQLVEESSMRNNSFVLHRHQLLQDYRLDPPIVQADLFFRDGSSIRSQLDRYLVHGASAPLDSLFVIDAYRAVIQQTAALNVFSSGPGSGLPLHFATTQTLALSLSAVL